MPAKGIINLARAKYTKDPQTLREYLDNVLYEHPELTMVEIAQKLGVAANALSCWRRGQPIPIVRAMTLAKIVGDDVRMVRSIGIRERNPELFCDEYGGKQDSSLVTDNEMEFLKIIRNSSIINPKMTEAQKKKFAAFVEKCEGEKK